MSEAETITATTHDDGTMSVDGFPARVKFSTMLLVSAHPLLLRTHIILTATNGKAVYEVDDGDERIFSARLIELNGEPVAAAPLASLKELG